MINNNTLIVIQSLHAEILLTQINQMKCIINLVQMKSSATFRPIYAERSELGFINSGKALFI